MVSVPVSPALEEEHAASVESCSGETQRSNVTVCSWFVYSLCEPDNGCKKLSFSEIFQIYSLWRIKFSFPFSLMEDTRCERQSAERKVTFMFCKYEELDFTQQEKLLSDISDLSPGLDLFRK